MPCLFTSTKDPVDLLWIGEVILVCPDGPERPAEAELQINGLIRPRAESATVTFVHRGEIYSIKERSAEWTAASQTEDAEADWFSHRIFNNPALVGSRFAKGVKKGTVQLKTTLPTPVEATVARPELSKHISVFCAAEDNRHACTDSPETPTFQDALFSTFDLKFEQPNKIQVFRVSFRTRHGLRDFGWQVGVFVQGPDRAIADIRTDIASRIENADRRAALRRRIDELFDARQQPDYEVAVVGHPYFTLATEERQSISSPISFPIESKGTPIPYAACPARVDFYDVRSRDFFVKLLANRVMDPSRVVYDQDFLGTVSKLQSAKGPAEHKG